jgi:hypothetical protein
LSSRLAVLGDSQWNLEAEVSPVNDKHPLVGGVMADVTRAGNTVRRTCTPAASTIHRFLHHLLEKGFTQVPRPLGFDATGREILSYVEGRAGHPPITSELASDEALVSAAQTIRAFHDASIGFDAEGWNTDSADPSGRAEVICHNDLAPFNLVYQHRKVAAIIDWDGAAPGRRVWDIAYAVWRLVPLHRPAYTTPLGWPELDRSRRLALFADAYDMTGQDRDEVLDVVRQRQLLNREGMRKLAAIGRIQALDPDDPRAEARDLAYLDQNMTRWKQVVRR